MESKRRMAALENEKKKEDTRMSQWIDAVFGDAFIAYTHLKALSAFVEAVLRYGLNKDGAPDYVSFLVKPWGWKSMGSGVLRLPWPQVGAQSPEPCLPTRQLRGACGTGGAAAEEGGGSPQGTRGAVQA